jgi:hypothetical protein
MELENYKKAATALPKHSKVALLRRMPASRVKDIVFRGDKVPI